MKINSGKSFGGICVFILEIVSNEIILSTRMILPCLSYARECEVKFVMVA